MKLKNHVPLAVIAALLTACGPGPENAVDVDVPAPDDGNEAAQPDIRDTRDEGDPVKAPTMGAEEDRAQVPTPGTDSEVGYEATADAIARAAEEGRRLMAMAMIAPTEGNETTGTIEFSLDEAGAVKIDGTLKGLTPGKHGLHIHEIGDCSAPDGTSAGGHFAPDGDPHGAPDSPADQHHVGDLGNVTANEQGFAVVDTEDAEMVLDSANPKGVIGRAVIVHAGEDDLTSQPTGAAGARVGCGVIKALSRAEVPDVE